jgi:hypothetical protein
MHFATPTVAEDVRNARNLDAQIAALRGRYGGERCVVVTCGPSLAAYPADELRQGLEGICTIVVKQAIDVVAEQTDFHCWNTFNVSKWSPGSPATIRCLVDDGRQRMPQFNRADIKFPQVAADGDLQRSLAHRGDFSEYRLQQASHRPFGPGIMYEIVFHLAVHLGVSEVVTIGWDIANSSGGNTHYYDQPQDRSFFEQERTVARIEEPRQNLIPDLVRLPVRRARAYAAHRRGSVYNRARTLPGETDLVAASTKHLAAWLTEVGVHLMVATDSPYLDASIDRISPNDLLSRLASG